ncbi:hypothetical protein GGH92_009667, partial [Coemansia sp. RSA 2673]
MNFRDEAPEERRRRLQREYMQFKRSDPVYRVEERTRNTAARRGKRADPIIRKAEQVKDTAAHR